nr:mannitol dehydrogenase family protein [Nocardioides lijunqiniae]
MSSRELRPDGRVLFITPSGRSGRYVIGALGHVGEPRGSPNPDRSEAFVQTTWPDPPISLRRGTLPHLPAAVARPSYDVRSLRAGVVHLGVGMFHRAHQAVYLDRIADEGISDRWGVVGIGVRRCRARRELLAQDCLYSVTELSDDEPRVRVIGVLRDYASVAEDRGRALAALVHPDARLVTLTVTAPTYTGGETAAFDLLADALDLRRRRGLPPFTVMSCDNLPANGSATRRCVVEAAGRHRSPGLASWVAHHVAFPDTMVDRITPTPTAAHRTRLRRHSGLDDRAPVMTEPSSHWVVQDCFSGERPPLEEVGVHVVADVGPHTAMKTRMLNAAHLALGYLGAPTQHATTDAAMADPALGGLVEQMLRLEVQPLLAPAAGVDPDAYRHEVLTRLGNPAIGDPLARLRRRGSVRMRHYVLPSLEDAVLGGRPHRVLLSVLAAWVDHLSGLSEEDLGPAEREALCEPALDALLPLAREAHADVRPLLAAVEGFERLRARPAFVRDLQDELAAVRGGARAAS